MINENVRIILTRGQAERLMNLLAIQTQSSIAKQFNSIRESYGNKGRVAVEFERDYPNASIDGMVDIADKLFSKLKDSLNPESITIDLTK